MNLKEGICGCGEPVMMVHVDTETIKNGVCESWEFDCVGCGEHFIRQIKKISNPDLTLKDLAEDPSIVWDKL